MSEDIKQDQVVGEEAQAEYKAEPTPVTRAGYSDVQTAENTSMSNKQDPKSQVTRELTQEEIETNGYLTIKLGSSLEENQKVYRSLVNNWLRYVGTTEGHKEGRFDDNRLNKAKIDWENFCKENYPDKTLLEVEDEASSVYTFTSQLLDDSILRTGISGEEGITNVSDRGSGHVTPDIVGKTPGKSTAGFSPSQIMLRATISADKDKLNFDVLLRDSFVMFTFTRPSKMEMGSLYTDIKNTIGGYVREIHYNLPVVARIAIGKVIWDFISKRIVYSSVSDLNDYVGLAQVIRLKDLERIAIALLESYNTKGVSLQLSCLKNSCNWSSHALVDPTLLIQNRDVSTDEELSVYANLFNKRKTYTIAETLELSNNANYNVPVEERRVYNEDKSIYLSIGQPTLAQSFSTFDYFISQVNPKIAEIKATTIDPDEYEDRMSMMYNDIGSTEFVHWIKGFHRVPSPDTDEQPINLLRDDAENLLDFDKGLISVLSESNSLSKGLMSYVVNDVSKLSKHFVGIQNSVCPSCKTEQGSVEINGAKPLGYTPVDPFMGFFILTQLKLLSQTQDLANHRDEVLSK